MAEPPLPTFLVIGAQKSGTRWLRDNLRCHPQVFAPTVEPLYFSNQTRVAREGPEWYRNQFADWSGEPFVGESSPSYLSWRRNPPAIAARIRDLIPDVRLLAILRNPVDRARSGFLHNIRRARLDRGTRLLSHVGSMPPENDPLGIITLGWYARCLQPYYDLFADQLLVVLHDDMVTDPEGTYLRTVAHVGADSSFVPKSVTAVVGGRAPRRRWRPTSWFRSSRSVSIDLTPAERIELYEYFRSDVEDLAILLGRDLSAWLPPASAS